MPGFDDLVLAAGQAAFVADGCQSVANEGRTWLARLEVLDASDDPVDFTSVEGFCEVWDRSTLVTTIPVTLTLGQIEIRKAAAATAGLAAGVRGGRRCRWSLYLAKGVEKVQVWSPDNSFLTIHNATGV